MEKQLYFYKTQYGTFVCETLHLCLLLRIPRTTVCCCCYYYITLSRCVISHLLQTLNVVYVYQLIAFYLHTIQVDIVDIFN